MKPKRYHVITFLLSVYALFMTLHFGLDLLKSGHAQRFWLTLLAETLVLIAAFVFLRKRDKIRIQNKSKDIKKG